ncbi:MAG: TM2 domain-containing protein [Bacteroides sp.]
MISPADQFLMMNGRYFRPQHFPQIQMILDQLNERQLAQVAGTDYKDPTTLLIISIFVGQLGVDRFLLGQVGLGVLKLLTLGGCWIWWLVDCILIMGNTRDHNMAVLIQAATQAC